MPLRIRTIFPTSGSFFKKQKLFSKSNRFNNTKDNNKEIETEDSVPNTDINNSKFSSSLPIPISRSSTIKSISPIPSSPLKRRKNKFPSDVFNPSPLSFRKHKRRSKNQNDPFNLSMTGPVNNNNNYDKPIYLKSKSEKSLHVKNKMKSSNNNDENYEYENTTIINSPDKVLMRLMKTNRKLHNKIEKLGEKANSHVKQMEVNKKIQVNQQLEEQIEDELQDLEDEYAILKARNTDLKNKVTEIKHQGNGRTTHELEHRLVLLNIQLEKHVKENIAIKIGIDSQNKSSLKEVDLITHYKQQEMFKQQLLNKYKKACRKKSRPTLLQSKLFKELRSLQERNLRLKKEVKLLKNNNNKNGRKSNEKKKITAVEQEEEMMLKALCILKKSIISQKKKHLQMIKSIDSKIREKKEANSQVIDKIDNKCKKSKALGEVMRIMLQTVIEKKKKKLSALSEIQSNN